MVALSDPNKPSHFSQSGDAGPELHVHASREDGRAGDNNAHTEPVRSYELGYSCGVLRNSRVEVEVGDSLVSWSS